MGSERVSLIVGGDSAIGTGLRPVLERTGRVWVTSRRPSRDAGALHLDLSRPFEPRVVPGVPDVVYLCAAIGSLERCEQEPALTRAVNVENTVALAQHFAARGAFVVFLSTSLVFDGSRPCEAADARPTPTTEYGRQKALAERQLLELGSRTAVVRLTKVLTRDFALFGTWAEALRRGETIQPFSDKVFAPVSLPRVLELLNVVGERQPAGILQFSAAQDVSYADAAGRLAERAGAGAERVRPCRMAEKLAGGFPNPGHTTLATDRLTSELGIEAPAAWEAIDWAIAPFENYCRESS